MLSLLCAPVCTASSGGHGVVDVMVWNQLGQPRRELVMLPVASASAMVRDGRTGQPIPSQILPVGPLVLP